MSKKFNPKEYRGRDRVYTRVGVNLTRLWVWTGLEYAPPDRGNVFYARKKRRGKYEYQSFENIPEARTWLNGEQEPEAKATEEHLTESGETFGDVVAEFKKRKYPLLALGTRDQYEKLLGLYFAPLLSVSMADFKPLVVDEWIDWLKSDTAGFLANPNRKAFKHELQLLTTILSYYREYRDDSDFANPIKRRHRQAINLNRERRATPKDLTESEFLKFREHLRSSPRGGMMTNLATIQFYHALRINEAAGLFWEDVHLDMQDPANSRLRIVRSVQWIRRRGNRARIVAGFKNSKALSGVKEQPLNKETFDLFMSMRAANPDPRGLIFQENGVPLEYRWIQYAYDRGFKRAKLPYTATHVMRHGGTRKVYNETGDLAIAGQILGNTTTQSVQVYARRNTNALNEHVRKLWLIAKAK
jgi:site-specific recombinase XerC